MHCSFFSGHPCATLVVLCVALLLGSSVAASGVPTLRLNDGPCSSPPAGFWKMETHLPVVNETLEHSIDNNLTLTVILENTYHGDGEGVFIVDVPPFKAGTSFTYHTLAIFHPDTCTMSGSNYNYASNATDSFVWVYDGQDSLEGPAVVAFNGQPIFKHRGYERLTIT